MKNNKKLVCIMLSTALTVLLNSLVYAKAKIADKDSKAVPALAKNYFVNQTEQTRQSNQLPDEVSRLLKKYKIPTKDLSVYIRDLNSEQPMLTHNIDTIRSPASTMKLLTTYAALNTLTPTYSWRTEAWMRGEVKAGVLAGDLILKGYGDPFLVYENYWKFIRGLREKGLKEIQGDVIIDNSYFDIGDFDSAAFDNKPFRVYNAPPSALMFNFQSTRFLFTPDKENKKINITPHPAIPGFSYKNEVRYSNNKCRRSHYRPKFSYDKKGVLTIKGSYSYKCGKRYVLRSVSKPAEHAFNGFREFWLELDGTLLGDMKRGRKESADSLFHVTASATLGEQIRLINKWSNNVMTRQLLLTLGAKVYGAPGTLQKGRDAILSVLQAHDINTQGVFVDNGAGLSRKARISARQMGQVLEMAYRDAFMPEFMASLALSGLDGTMVSRFRRDDLRGRSHLKTGTLNKVTAIAGYMLNRKGKRLVIVIQQNGSKVGRGRGAKIQNALLRWSFEQ